MPGEIQPPFRVPDAYVPTEEEGIALALAMCPVGESIEIHTAKCPVIPCQCVPRIITKTAPSAA